MSDLNTKFELYFGRSCPNGSTITVMQFERFLVDTVAENFPEGFTVAEKNGAWKDRETGLLIRERTSVLGILAPNDDRTREVVAAIARIYAVRFNQDAVLVTETAVSAVSFVEQEYVSPEAEALERSVGPIGCKGEGFHGISKGGN